jgi:hypothetical protein
VQSQVNDCAVSVAVIPESNFAEMDFLSCSELKRIIFRRKLI